MFRSGLRKVPTLERTAIGRITTETKRGSRLDRFRIVGPDLDIRTSSTRSRLGAQLLHSHLTCAPLLAWRRPVAVSPATETAVTDSAPCRHHSDHVPAAPLGLCFVCEPASPAGFRIGQFARNASPAATDTSSSPAEGERPSGEGRIIATSGLRASSFTLRSSGLMNNSSKPGNREEAEFVGRTPPRNESWSLPSSRSRPVP